MEMQHAYESIYADLYKDHPFKETQDKSAAILSTVWRNKDFVKTFELGDKKPPEVD